MNALAGYLRYDYVLGSALDVIAWCFAVCLLIKTWRTIRGKA